MIAERYTLPMSIYKFPPLTDHLIDMITFSMENQGTDSYLDLKEGVVITSDELNYSDQPVDEARLVSLPEWSSAEGFQLMERYAQEVRNEAMRERLLAALNRGKGVFRAFKDVLSDEPVLEQKWYLFKDQELRKHVILWYQKEVDSAELATLPPEDEELFEEILLEDFTFEACDEFEKEEIQTLVQTLLLEIGKTSSAGLLIEQALKKNDQIRTHLARTATGELAGVIVYTLADEATAEILLYGVDLRYRGLGLFRLLFDGFSRQLGRLRVSRILFTILAQDAKLKEFFIRYGAHEITTTYALTTHAWNSNHTNSETAFV